jgi:hypothetical protein
VRDDITDVLPGLLWTTGIPLAGAKGRGGVAVLSLKRGIQAVARDYRRGGALGFLLRRSYLDPERPQRELNLLQKLSNKGVPVVTPLAALAKKQGLFYRLRLLTELLPGALPLPAFLAEHPRLRGAAIEEAGRVVRMAFAAGLWHPDLHPDNLLAWVPEAVAAAVPQDAAQDAAEDLPQDGGAEAAPTVRPAVRPTVRPEVRLLDLDRAELRNRLSNQDQNRMLLRMARYLRRHAGDLPIEPTTQDHLRFLKGMGMKPEERHLRMRELVPQLERELSGHGIA